MQEFSDDLQRKVDALLDVTESASTGDLTAIITGSGDNAIGRPASGFETMIVSMSDVLGEVGGAATQPVQGGFTTGLRQGQRPIATSPA